MSLIKYRIDASILPPGEREESMEFIESRSFNHSFIPGSNGAYECFWEETVNPLDFPLISRCIVQRLP